jgi:hypothetical protein
MSSASIILDRFTALNPTTLRQPLTTDNVTIESLGPLNGPSVNTQATLRPLDNGGFTQSVTIGWRRLDLGLLFMAIPVVLHDPTALTTRDLVPLLNAQYGTTLDPSDVLSASLPPNANKANVVITADPASLYVIGSFTLRFTKA